MDLFEQARELAVEAHRFLEVPRGSGGCEREHLESNVVAPAILEQSRLLEVRAVLLDLLPELRDVLAATRLGQDDRDLQVRSWSSARIERTSFSIVFAAGWSVLLIAITSGISMIPAFSA